MHYMKESLKTSTFQVSKRTLNIIAHQLLWLKNNTTLSSSWGDGTEGACFIMRKSLSPVETSVKVCNCMVPKTEMLWQDTAHKTRLPLCPQATVSKDNFSKHKDYSSLLHLPSYIWSVQATQMVTYDSCSFSGLYSFVHLFGLLLPLVCLFNRKLDLIMLSVTNKSTIP